MNLILDTSLLGQLCHPAKATNKPAVEWITRILESGSEDRVFLPEICDYELRRKLIHLIGKGQADQRSVDRLDELSDLLEYLPLDTATMRKSACFWAESRSRGLPTSPETALDGDVIVAAQAAQVDGVVVTSNRKHLSQFIPAMERTEFQWVYVFFCIRGAVDNLAFHWEDHTVVRDSRDRVWHCRSESTVQNLRDFEPKKPPPSLLSVFEEIQQLSSRLLSAGQVRIEESATELRTRVIYEAIPRSKQSLYDQLADLLGADSDDGS